MEQITLCGTLVEDARSCQDKAGHPYVRFTVGCGRQDQYGRTIYTNYRCTCYVPGYDKLKKGDQVFITGKLSSYLGFGENGKPKVNLDVMIYQVAPGYKAAAINTAK